MKELKEIDCYHYQRGRNNNLIFSDNINLLNAVFNKQTLFLHQMAARMSKSNVVKMTKEIRLDILYEIGAESNDGWSLSKQYLQTLLKNKLIVYIGCQRFMLNPKLFGLDEFPNKKLYKRFIYQKTKINQPANLYRHYDKDDTLLYIGISVSAISRFQQHILNSKWADASVKMTTERFNSRREALQAEKKAIKQEKPLFNISHNLNAEK